MLTLSHCTQKGTFCRIIRAKNGSLIRVSFEVYEFEGSIKGRVISVEPVISLENRELRIENRGNSMLCLPCDSSNLKSQVSNLYFASVKSPYIELYFFNSQPTRAPSK